VLALFLTPLCQNVSRRWGEMDRPDGGRHLRTHPVFIRGGVPLKVIEAMARGKAVVASPELIDGLAIADGKDMLVRTAPDDFAAAIVSLIGERFPPGAAWRSCPCHFCARLFYLQRGSSFAS